MSISSVEIKDDKFFSIQRSSSKTITIKSKLKPVQASQQKEEQNQAKQAVRKTLYEIEDNFKLLKFLPNQRLHPFDLSQDELLDIKTHFPEFFPKNLAAKRAVRAKGIEIEDLKHLLAQKINISEEKLNLIVAKLDHKSATKVSWTEFLGFL